jgi:hypothetical protein
MTVPPLKCGNNGDTAPIELLSKCSDAEPGDGHADARNRANGADGIAAHSLRELAFGSLCRAFAERWAVAARFNGVFGASSRLAGRAHSA